jgi:hypothetical protein
VDFCSTGNGQAARPVELLIENLNTLCTPGTAAKSAAPGVAFLGSEYEK